MPSLRDFDNRKNLEGDTFGKVCYSPPNLFKQRLLKGTLRPKMPSLRHHESTIPSGGGHVQTKEGVKWRLTDVFRECRKLLPPTGWVFLSKRGLLKGTLRPKMPSLRRYESTIPSGGGHVQTKEGVSKKKM